MKTSARNRLPGTITSIKQGGVVAQVVMQIGENVVEAVITNDAVQDLDLKAGDQVYAVIKATEVMVAKEENV